MQSKPQNPPDKHHYVPVFLLHKWASADGKLWRYYRNQIGELECRPTTPAGMGYKPGLYKTLGLPPEHEQQVEQHFMAPLDSAAAKVHELLLAGQVRALTDQQRRSWAGFVMSLWHRTPNDVGGLRAMVDTLHAKNLNDAARDGVEPIDLPDAVLNQMAMQVLMTLIDDAGNGTELINMNWGVIEIDPRREFFVTDYPLAEPRHFPRLGNRASYLAMPIAPTKLFVGAVSPTLIDALKSLPQRDLVQRQNRAMVEQAEHFVGTTDRSADKFIRANFGMVQRLSPTRPETLAC